MSTVTEEFSRFATSYNKYSVIQEKVAQKLIDTLPFGYDYYSILDLGCGEGQIFKKLEQKNIITQNFFALDSSIEMLNLHPLKKNITKINANFNTNFIDTLSIKRVELLLSSSALQWSKNLDFTLEQLAKLSTKHYYAIFTSNTFKTLHKTAKIDSPIYSSRVLKEKLLIYYPNSLFEIKTYNLKFESTREMLQYIKKSGVSSGEKKLSYLQTKQLIQDYPLDYLEFEVLFVCSVND